jgi:hypothetical protein
LRNEAVTRRIKWIIITRVVSDFGSAISNKLIYWIQPKQRVKDAPVRFVHGLKAFRQMLGHALGSGGVSDLFPEL